MADPVASAASIPNLPGGVGDWRHQLLSRLRAPESKANLAALAYWAASEGMPASAHNWLATSLRLAPWHMEPPYSEPFYATVAQGVTATARTLTATRGAGYEPIVAALRADAGAQAIYNAINASKWCAGCTGGHYPNALRVAIANGNIRRGVAPTAGPRRIDAPAPDQSSHDYHAKVVRAGREHIHTATHLQGNRRALRSLLSSRRLK